MDALTHVPLRAAPFTFAVPVLGDSCKSANLAPLDSGQRNSQTVLIDEFLTPDTNKIRAIISRPHEPRLPPPSTITPRMYKHKEEREKKGMGKKIKGKKKEPVLKKV